MKIAVCGSNGYVGRALVASLQSQGHEVREVARPRHDLTNFEDCKSAVYGMNQVYNLAAKVGGIDFIQKSRLDCILSSRINTNLLMACRELGVQRYFFASSACVYPSNDFPIAENYAYPSRPEPGYGEEKLFGEQMCRAFREAGAVETRVARLFTLYGPGDNKKHNHAPAELCKKIALAKLLQHDSVEIWGNGNQTRSLLYIDDCVDGIQRVMNSGLIDPVNLSGSEGLSINRLADLIEEIAGVELVHKYRLSAVTGVAHRTSDNGKILRELGWEPPTKLRDGLEKTFRWWWDWALANANS